MPLEEPPTPMRMITFTVHEEARPRADRIDRAERLVFVKDGFSIVAAYLGPIWLLANRLWLPLLAYVLGAAGTYLAFTALAIPMRWLTTVLLAVHVVIGFESDSLKRYGLGRRGWATVGTVSGRNQQECERRFFDAWLPGEPMIAAHGRELSPPPPAAPPAVSPRPPQPATELPPRPRSRWSGLFRSRA
jgi:hypothetical protein